jgi:hypothetical protein
MNSNEYTSDSKIKKVFFGWVLGGTVGMIAFLYIGLSIDFFENPWEVYYVIGNVVLAIVMTSLFVFFARTTVCVSDGGVDIITFFGRRDSYSFGEHEFIMKIAYPEKNDYQNSFFLTVVRTDSRKLRKRYRCRYFTRATFMEMADDIRRREMLREV